MSRIFCFSVLAILLFSVASTQAQIIDDALRLTTPGVTSNARALGMGNSFLSVSDDASAIYFNPAGLALVKRMEISGGLDYQKISNSTSFYGTNTDYSNSKTALNQFAFVLPFPTYQGSFAVGISYNQSKNFLGALKYDGFNPGPTMIKSLAQGNKFSLPYYLYLADSMGNTGITNGLQQYGTSLSSGTLDNWNFSASFEIAKNLFFGATLGISSGKYSNSWDFTEEDINGTYTNIAADPMSPSDTKGFTSFNMNNSLDWDITGFEFTAGLLYQLKQYGRIGLTIALPKSYTVKETFGSSTKSLFNTGSPVTDYSESKVEYDISTPFIFSLGGSFNMQGWLASADVSFIDYTEMEFSNPTGIEQTVFTDLNRSIKEQMRSTVNYNLGVEYTFADLGLRLRGGYFLQASPYKDAPSSFNKKYFTFGFGFLVEEAVSIDLAYLHGNWTTYESNYGGYSVTDQDIKLSKLVASFSYRF